VNDLPSAVTGALCANETCTRFHREVDPFGSGSYWEVVSRYGLVDRYLFEVESDGSRRCFDLDYSRSEDVPSFEIAISSVPLCD